MRMFLTRFRVVTVDLVKGKTVWRLTGITGDSTNNLFQEEQVLQPAYRMFRLVEFLVQGESAHLELFEFLKEIVKLRNVASADGLEIFCVIKVLEYLGYWNGVALPADPSVSVLDSCITHKKEWVKKINESISATQIMVY